MRMSVIEWLLDSDPSIRWQVMRDLIDESNAAVARERARGRGGLGGSSSGPSRSGRPLGACGVVPHAWISTNDTLQLLLVSVSTPRAIECDVHRPRPRGCTWGGVQ